MKRTCCVLLLFCIALASFSGCGKAQLKNYIAVKTLSEDQKQIVDLISSNERKYLFFEIKTEEAYKGIEFWMEIYKKGELVDSQPVSLRMTNDNGIALDSEFAVIINATPDYKWTFIYAGKEGGVSGHSNSEPNKNYASGINAWCTLYQPVEIEDGKEIAIYASAFNQNGKIEAFDLSKLIDDNYLAACDYVHLIKCKFTK